MKNTSSLVITVQVSSVHDWPGHGRVLLLCGCRGVVGGVLHDNDVRRQVGQGDAVFLVMPGTNERMNIRKKKSSATYLTHMEKEDDSVFLWVPPLSFRYTEIKST